MIALILAGFGTAAGVFMLAFLHAMARELHQDHPPSIEVVDTNGLTLVTPVRYLRQDRVA